jgi:type I restriction enzyme S subunit
LETGDLLFSHINSTEHIGKCAIYEGVPDKLVHGMNLLCLRPDKSYVFPRYLFHFLRHRLFKDQLARIIKPAVNQASVTISDLSTLRITLPPLPDQVHIAAVLDKADSIRLKHEQALTLANQFLRAVFLDRFGDPQTNSKGVPMVPIKRLAQVVTGNTPPRNRPDYYGQGVDWVKSDNLGAPDHYVTKTTEQLSVSGQSVARLAPVGSTLITCIAGSPSSIGNAALADREVAFNQQINAVIPSAEVDPAFLYCQFLVGKALIQRASTNSMKGMVTKRKFEEILFLNPPASDQRQFGRVFFRVVEHLRHVRQATDQSKELFASLSQRAFTDGLALHVR